MLACHSALPPVVYDLETWCSRCSSAFSIVNTERDIFVSLPLYVGMDREVKSEAKLPNSA